MIEFTVFGHAEPKGSTKAFIPKGWKRPVITTSSAKMKPWAQQVSRAAFDQIPKPFDRDTAICLTLHFFLARPESKPKRIWAHTTKPDIDKLARGVMDALTGILFADDAQVIHLHIKKEYGLPERVEISAHEAVEDIPLFTSAGPPNEALSD